MREDRYAVNRFLYIIGFICLWCSMGLLFLSIYTFPYLILGYQYDVPDFIYTIQSGLVEDQGYSSGTAAWIIMGGMLGVMFVLGFISKHISNQLESKMVDFQDRILQEHDGGQPKMVTFYKVLGVVLIVLILAYLLI